ncbi:hypothetical protein [Gracilinema caldarium]|uniref:hypothetical protein n=1 Tax=Gracilinema caldarium TaxID=215591 RepID=UPI0026ED6A83|nr:hypothetical protein [Gracilinema caldarium]
MENFRNLFITKTGFIPRTQAQALTAYMEDIIGPEYYVYRAVNVHPLLEEPWDFQEIDRLLAKNELDIDTITILVTIFDKMLQLPDKEQALFAAESINALEQRYLSIIVSMLKKLETEETSESVRTIMQAYLSLAAISKKRPLLRTFYLGEAKATFKKYRHILTDPEKDIAVFIKILFDLNQLAEARKEIMLSIERYPKNTTLHLLAAEYNFKIGSFRSIGNYLNKISRLFRDSKDTELLKFWGIGVQNE